MTEFNKSEYFTNLESDLWKEEAEKGGETKEEKEEKGLTSFHEELFYHSLILYI